MRSQDKMKNHMPHIQQVNIPAQMLIFQEECLLWRTGPQEYGPREEIRLQKIYEKKEINYMILSFDCLEEKFNTSTNSDKTIMLKKKRKKEDKKKISNKRNKKMIFPGILCQKIKNWKLVKTEMD